MTFQLRSIDLTAQSINLFVGKQEAEILRAIWAGARTLREIHTAVLTTYGKVAITTTATTLTRMVDKRLVKRTRVTRWADNHFEACAPNEKAFIRVCLTQVYHTLWQAYPLITQVNDE